MSQKAKPRNYNLYSPFLSNNNNNIRVIFRQHQGSPKRPRHYHSETPLECRRVSGVLCNIFHLNLNRAIWGVNKDGLDKKIQGRSLNAEAPWFWKKLCFFLQVYRRLSLSEAISKKRLTETWPRRNHVTASLWEDEIAMWGATPISMYIYRRTTIIHPQRHTRETANSVTIDGSYSVFVYVQPSLARNLSSVCWLCRKKGGLTATALHFHLVWISITTTRKYF